MRLTDQRAIDYIKKQKKAGYSENQIIQAMVRAGYDEHSVKETLEFLKTQKTHQEPQRKKQSEHNISEELGPVPKGKFKRSWYLTKTCWKVIKSDGELMAYTVLSMIFNLMFLALMIGPSIYFGIFEQGILGSIMNYVIIFITYLGVAFIATFFNTATTHVVKERIEGSNPTFGDGINFATKRIHRVIEWSLLSATIGLVLRIIENLAEKLPGIGRLIVALTTGLLGLAWSLASMFAIPSMVLHDVGPWKALKNSVETLKKTWGENLIFGMSTALIMFLFWCLGGVMMIGGVMLSAKTGSISLMIASIAITLIYFILVTLFFKVADKVFNTAVFLYAANGTIAPQFPEKLLENAFRTK